MNSVQASKLLFCCNHKWAPLFLKKHSTVVANLTNAVSSDPQEGTIVLYASIGLAASKLRR